jgi:hypothetical protein
VAPFRLRLFLALRRRFRCGINDSLSELGEIELFAFKMRFQHPEAGTDQNLLPISK